MRSELSLKAATQIWETLTPFLLNFDPYAKWGFIAYATSGNWIEYRLPALGLGFGGKIWNAHGKIYVNCYPEDLTSEREEKIKEINRALGGQ